MKSAAAPLSATVCGLPGALSVTVSDADRVPVADGVNVTEIVHVDALPATVAQPELVSAKSPAFVPVMAMLVMVSVDCKALVRVRVCGLLAVPTAGLVKARLGGLNTTADAVAVPVKVKDCVVGVALSVIVSVPLAAPALAGVNVTLRAQLLPAATEVPQVLVSPNPLLATTLVIVSARLPVFFSVTV